MQFIMTIDALESPMRRVHPIAALCVWLAACGNMVDLELTMHPSMPNDHIIVRSHPPTASKVLWNETLSLANLDTARVPNPAQIRYLVDAGPLGPLTNAQATQLVQTLLPRWEAVAGVSFTFDGHVTEDITAENFSTYWNANEDQQCPWLTEVPVATDPITVIFDHDGLILDSLGRSASRGVCLQCIQQFDAEPWLITKNLIIIDGTDLTANSDEPELLQRQLPAAATTILHEFGHALGLWHAAISIGGAAAPIMAPALSTIGGTPPIPRPDDIAWLDYLYPQDIATPIGGLAGTIHFNHGIPNATYYASVTAINAANAQCELFQNWVELRCQTDGICTGDFLLPRLPAGNYVVLVDRVQTGGQFVEVSWELWNSSDTEDESPSHFEIVSVATSLMTAIDLTLTAPAAGSVPVITIPDVQTYDSALSGTLQNGDNGRCQPDGSNLAAVLGIVVPSSATPSENEEATDGLPESEDAATELLDGEESTDALLADEDLSPGSPENEGASDASPEDEEISGASPTETRVDPIANNHAQTPPTVSGGCSVILPFNDRESI